MRQAAVARAEPPRGGERHQLVAPQVHRRLDRGVELRPRGEDLGPIRERALVVDRHRRIVQHRPMIPPARLGHIPATRKRPRKESRHARASRPTSGSTRRARRPPSSTCSVFPNSEITAVTYYGEAGPRPAGTVLTVDFVLDGQEFTAINGGPQFTFNEAISLLINCADQDEIDYYWDKLIRRRRGEPVRLAEGQVTGCRGRSCPRAGRADERTPTRPARSGPWRRCSR